MPARYYALLFVLFPWISLCAQETLLLKYTVFLSGNRAGFQTVEQTGNDLKIIFEFNDRGRGPKLVSQLKLSKSGLPVEVTIQGNDYMKGYCQSAAFTDPSRFAGRRLACSGRKGSALSRFEESDVGIAEGGL